HHDLIHQWVHELAEIRDRSVTPRNFAIDVIGQTGNEENDEGSGARVIPTQVEHGHEEHRQNEPADGETVCPVHARASEVWIVCCGEAVASSLNTGCFQIGTTRFSSSMIDSLAEKSDPRC